jgi:hypothetical protein
MDEHRSARSMLQRALVCGLLGTDSPPGAVDSAALEQALAHVTSCDECSSRFDFAQTVALIESMEKTQDMAEEPVDPAALFESALTVGLADPDNLIRRRAAERLGEMTGLGASAVRALAGAAGTDRDEQVRAAALAALQSLDPALTLPQWLISAWSAAPAEAAPYLEDVLARLASPAAAPSYVAPPTDARTQAEPKEPLEKV